ncbi:MAG: sigma-70 family RNA polymerase sigma factor [Deltaproteobacteria bacterium]|nr:sigma-70 family RNA polymerase sigma factor [Deltaproteobacteria bacterium]
MKGLKKGIGLVIDQVLPDSIVKSFEKAHQTVNINQVVTELLNNLNERRKEIIKGRFVQGKTLEELGKEFNLTRERVRQIIMQCLSKWRRPLSILRRQLEIFLIENQQFACFDKFLDKHGIVELEKRQFLQNLLVYYFKDKFLFFDDYIVDKKFGDSLSKIKELLDVQIEEIGLPFENSQLYQMVKGKSEKQGLSVSSELLEFLLAKNEPIFHLKNPNLVVYLSKLSLPDNVALFLKNCKEPMHFTVLARYFSSITRKEISPHHLEARMRGDKRFILVDAGSFMFYKNYGQFLKAQSGLSCEELKDLMRKIVKRTIEMLGDNTDFTDTKFLLSRLKKEMDIPEAITPYALKDLLLRCPYFEGGRKFEVKFVKEDKKQKSSLTRKEYADLIWEVLHEAKEPLHVNEIQEKLRERFREIPVFALNMILANNERFIRVDQSTYTIAEILGLTNDNVLFIRDFAYELIKQRKEPVSSIFLIQELVRHSKKYDVLNYQAVYSILKKDSRFIDLAPSFFSVKENLDNKIKTLKDYVYGVLKQINMPVTSDYLIQVLINKLGHFDRGHLNSVISWDKKCIIRNYGFVYLKEWDITEFLPIIFEKSQKQIRREIERFLKNPEKAISLDKLFIWLKFSMWSEDGKIAKGLVKIIDKFKPQGKEKEYLDRVKTRLSM